MGLRLMVLHPLCGPQLCIYMNVPPSLPSFNPLYLSILKAHSSHGFRTMSPSPSVTLPLKVADDDDDDDDGGGGDDYWFRK